MVINDYVLIIALKKKEDNKGEGSSVCRRVNLGVQWEKGGEDVMAEGKDMWREWPEEVRPVGEALEARGYRAYVVGGAVRDRLGKRVPTDWDMTTDATPEEMGEVFASFSTTWEGANFGTVGVLVNGVQVEVTTMRQDGVYTDSRHPDQVYYTTSLHEDLARRDFTINAMAWSPREGLVDPFGGRADYQARIIRAVGEPQRRMQEDALRLLRAIRFAGQLGFQVETETKKALQAEAPRIQTTAKERVGQEMVRIMAQEDPTGALQAMEQWGLLRELFPALQVMVGFPQKSPYHQWTLWEHTLLVVQEVARVSTHLSLRFAALFHDVGKPATQVIDEDGVAHYHGHDALGAQMAYDTILQLGLGKSLAKETAGYIAEHMRAHVPMGSKGLGRLIHRVGEEAVLELVTLWRADRLATQDGRGLEDIEAKERALQDYLNRSVPTHTRALAINGDDLLHIGYRQGKIIGETLQLLLERVWEDPGFNEKEKLLAWAKERLDAENGEV